MRGVGAAQKALIGLHAEEHVLRGSGHLSLVGFSITVIALCMPWSLMPAPGLLTFCSS